MIASDILSARTAPVEPTTTELQMVIVQVDLEIKAGKITADSTYLSWRFFNADEKPYIDGVQLR